MPVNPDALDSVATSPIHGRFYRLIRKRYAHQPLSMRGAFIEGQRYNVAREFAALCLGFDKETCQSEVAGGILAGLPIKPRSYVLWDYDISLRQVVRLDDDGICSHIGVTKTEIAVKGDHKWASLIGAPLFNRGLEGLVAPSAQKADGKCLNIFLDNVKTPSKVEPLTKVEEWPAPV